MKISEAVFHQLNYGDDKGPLQIGRDAKGVFIAYDTVEFEPTKNQLRFMHGKTVVGTLSGIHVAEGAVLRIEGIEGRVRVTLG